MKITYFKAYVLSILTLVFMAGCAAIETGEAQSTEQLLAAAGFVMVPAETAEEEAHLNSLTPRKVEFSVKDNKALYWYADPTGCKCVYTGDQAAYDRYQNLRVQQQIADEQDEAAEQVMADTNMWGWMGGPWGW